MLRLYFIGVLICTIMISGMAFCALQGNAPSKDTEGTGEETVVFPGYVTEGAAGIMDPSNEPTGGQPSITTPGFTTEGMDRADEKDKDWAPKKMPSEGSTTGGVGFGGETSPGSQYTTPTVGQPGTIGPSTGSDDQEKKDKGGSSPKMPSEGSTGGYTGGVGLGGGRGPISDDKGGEKGGGPGPKGFDIEYETPAEGSSGGQSGTGIDGSGGPIEY